jgi:hypothetical protein
LGKRYLHTANRLAAFSLNPHTHLLARARGNDPNVRSSLPVEAFKLISIAKPQHIRDMVHGGRITDRNQTIMDVVG